jgi:hypothetical protein
VIAEVSGRARELPDLPRSSSENVGLRRFCIAARSSTLSLVPAETAAVRSGGEIDGAHDSRSDPFSASLFRGNRTFARKGMCREGRTIAATGGLESCRRRNAELSAGSPRCLVS